MMAFTSAQMDDWPLVALWRRPQVLPVMPTHASVMSDCTARSMLFLMLPACESPTRNATRAPGLARLGVRHEYTRERMTSYGVCSASR